MFNSIKQSHTNLLKINGIFFKKYLKLSYYPTDKLFMKIINYFVLSFFFSSNVFAMTLGEVGTAASIANTLQGTAQIQPKNTLNKVKNKVQRYEQAQQKRLPKLPSTSNKPRPSKPDVHVVREERERERTIKEQYLEERFKQEKIQQETNPVDYKAGIQIFYKRDCSASQKNCNKGAVLTNIKSVIFDYAHTRGSFAEAKNLNQ